MAGEKKGEAFECLICIGLQDLGYKLGQNLFWDEKLSGFSIDPDFILGDVNAPTDWILATSSGSAKNSLEKFWRNVGEIFEAKRSFVNPPKVINLVFETNIRAALRLAMSSLADAELLVERSDYGKIIHTFIERILKTFPNTHEEEIKFLRAQLIADPKALSAYEVFKTDLKSTFAMTKPEFQSLWNILRNEKRLLQYREVRTTYMRISS